MAACIWSFKCYAATVQESMVNEVLEEMLPGTIRDFLPNILMQGSPQRTASTAVIIIYSCTLLP